MTKLGKFASLGLLAVATIASLPGQQPAPPGLVVQPRPPGTTGTGSLPPDPQAPDVGMDRLRLTYVLGTGDQVLLRVPEAVELNEKAFRITENGMILLGQFGEVRATGSTVQQFQAELTKHLEKYLRSPRVTVTVVQFRSDPVFFVGAFRSPGIYILQGSRTLVEMLSSIGGLLPTAGRRLKITRRSEQGRIPLESATEDSDRGVSVAEISISRLIETLNSQEDIVLKPYDVIRVDSEEMVYLSVAGGKGAAFPLGDRDSISILQLIAMAGGLDPQSMPEAARVLRPVLDTARRVEIPVNVKMIMAGKANDFPLLPNDVLVIPRGGAGFGVRVGRGVMVMLPGLAYSLIYLLIRN